MGWSHEVVDRRAVERYGLRGSADYIVDFGDDDPHGEGYFSWRGCDICGHGLGDTLHRVITLAPVDLRGQIARGLPPRATARGRRRFEVNHELGACQACVCYIANGECDPEGDCCRK
jgi:hypothetical protein